ncbi:unnamed protein product [Staurois parvus]|uniref:Uncharacterized protein n=1 Tax=Staurois parvus TaxID=386267 RepID=A0ABN9BH63_9NEOB|nr:unnamed protein product [Staurois parvus]
MYPNKKSISEMDTNRYNVAVSILFNVKYNSGALCRDRRNVSAVIGVFPLTAEF